MKTLVLKKEPILTQLNLTGEIIPQDLAHIYSKISGYVKKLPVDIGSLVKKGQILCILEAPELKSAKTEGSAKAEANFSKFLSSKSTYNRLMKASKIQGAISDSELELARNQMKSDSAQYKASLANLEVQKNQEGYLTIRAPFSGMITRRDVFLGDFTDNTGKKQLLELENNSQLRIQVPVPEAYNSTYVQGNKANFTVSANPGKVFTAQLIRKSGALDAQTRTEIWEFTFNNQSGLLKPGMFAQINLPVSRKEDGFLVPYKSVLVTQERKVVITQDSLGMAHWVDVKTGFTYMDKTEISGKLKSGDIILALPNEEIKEGSKIQ
jgi:RND family efflux transporter MFP subunit